MTIEEAIQTALQYENEIRDLYKNAVDRVADPTGKRVCTVLAREEQDHVDYLENRLAEWRQGGKVADATLETALPSPDKIALAAHEVSASISGVDRGTDLEMLGKALEAERKTSTFYRQMVSELPPEGQKLFEHFVAIEDGHLAIVQAEIDSLSGTGNWFDVYSR
jgi:rubrerythrin